MRRATDVHPRHPEVVVGQTVDGLILIGRPADFSERGEHAEREGAPVAQQARHLRDRATRVREDHRPVVAEDDVEPLVRKRNGLGAGMNQLHLDPGVGDQLASMLQLAVRDVQADRASAVLRQPDRPLGRAAAELELFY